MPSIVIVSGCPGSGKTTLAATLARDSATGVHIVSDLFYGFPTKPIDPTRPESQHQNEVTLRAFGRAARAFAEGGYDVWLDGVIGPWFLPLLQEELAQGPPVAYLMLQTGESEALRRVRERQGPGASASVRHMVAAFERDPSLPEHRIDTTGLGPDAVADLVRRGMAETRYDLAWDTSP